MVQLKPVKSVTLQDSVYEQLLNHIIRGEIKPGERITLAALAKQMGVSSQPVREALRRLEAQKFIRIESNRRIVVIKHSAEDLQELLEIRLLLEGYAVETASQVRTDEDLAALDDLMTQLNNVDSDESYLRINADFHFALYRAARRPQLMEVIETLWRRVSGYLYILIKARPQNIWLATLENHHNILEGVRQRDGQLARRWLTIDLTTAVEQLTEMMKEEDQPAS